MSARVSKAAPAKKSKATRSGQSTIAPALQIAFLGAIGVYYLAEVILSLLNTDLAAPYTTPANWAYGLSVLIEPLLYLLIGMVFVWRRYRGTLDRVFFGGLIGFIGIALQGAMQLLLVALSWKYDWFLDSDLNPDTWGLYGFYWAIMAAGLVIFSSVLLLLQRKKDA